MDSLDAFAVCSPNSILNKDFFLNNGNPVIYCHNVFSANIEKYKTSINYDGLYDNDNDTNNDSPSFLAYIFQ